ncbi:MAG: hypothetical protein FD123_65 [Bacteroidetes bacterium]|nr:MAG: hypothetical protein FD123_65 [Bacteroidota bacterium]
MFSFDYLIIGHGFAGSITALTLKQRGKTVCIIDDKSFSQCSRIAAGMLNPVNFQTRKPTWKAAETVPFAHQFYKTLEAQYDQKIFFQREYLRILSEEESQNWPQDKPFFGPVIQNSFPGIVQAPHGLGRVEQGGNLDTKLFYALVEQVFPEVVEERFDFSQLKFENNGVEYRGIRAKKIICCTGFRAPEENYFSFVPIKALKGQLLHLEIPELETDAILNGAGYLVPKNGGGFIFGATHEREIADEVTTAEGQNELEEKLRRMISVPYNVTGIVAGVRPTTRDHRPALGLHPERSQLAVFNGLGSKSVMQAPWLAEQLVSFLEDGKPLPKEIDVRRFVK